ncbi:MAG: DUF134 domain-containing protein [Candidatus Omnitrophota bacterium]
MTNQGTRGRPKKRRIVQKEPDIYRYSPRGRAGRPDEIALGIDQLEAVRLADYQGLSQKAAAQSMGVSQQTFSRILKKGRRIMADGLVNGKIILIQARDYVDLPPSKDYVI